MLQPHTSSLHILHIDDESGVRLLLKDMLGIWGHIVEEADDGHAGLELFRAAQRDGDPFDLVITDFQMPGLSGSDVARRIKKLSSETRVIMLTSSARDFSDNGGTPSGVDLLLQKPVSVSQLAQALFVATQPEPTPRA